MKMSVDGISFSGNIGNSSVKSKDKEQKENNCFDAILNMSIDRKETTDYPDQVYKHEVGKTDTRKYAIRNPEANERYKFAKIGIGKVVKKTDKADATDFELDNLEENALIFQNIKQELMDSLNISEKQFDDMMGELNLNTNDLLDVDNIKNIILNIYNTDKAELLVNQDLNNIINDSLQKVESIISQSFQSEDVAVPVLVEQNLEEAITDISEQNKILNSNSSEKIKQIEDEINIFSLNDSFSEEKINITVNAEPSTSDNLFENKNKGSDKNIQQIMTNLNQALENVVDETNSIDVPPYVDSVSELDIIKQIIDDIKVNLSRDNTSMEMQLNPENLGKVHISVVEKNGVMQAQITTETEAAKHAIETNIMLLRENFQNQELKVEAVEVMVANYEFFNHEGTNDNNADNEKTYNSSSKSISNVSNAQNGDEIDEREELEVKIMKENGNRISYLA